MEIANILDKVNSGTGAATCGRKAGLLKSLFQRKSILEGSGLHFTHKDRHKHCPLIAVRGTPILCLEGFRHDRYVLSAVFSGEKYSVLSSVACSLPPFTCSVRQGIPRQIKSPVSLPTGILAKWNNVELASDGRFLYSVTMSERKRTRWIVQKQLSDVILLESVIGAVEQPV